MPSGECHEVRDLPTQMQLHSSTPCYLTSIQTAYTDGQQGKCTRVCVRVYSVFGTTV
jgi:hypothetical protein